MLAPRALGTSPSRSKRGRGETARRGKDDRGRKSEVREQKVVERNSVLITFLLDSDT